jgi:hypothetical protein
MVGQMSSVGRPGAIERAVALSNVSAASRCSRGAAAAKRPGGVLVSDAAVSEAEIGVNCGAASTDARGVPVVSPGCNVVARRSPGAL